MEDDLCEGGQQLSCWRCLPLTRVHKPHWSFHFVCVCGRRASISCVDSWLPLGHGLGWGCQVAKGTQVEVSGVAFPDKYSLVLKRN